MQITDHAGSRTPMDSDWGNEEKVHIIKVQDFELTKEFSGKVLAFLQMRCPWVP